MNLSEKIELINDLIKENPDNTIKDFLEIILEIEGIESESYRSSLLSYRSSQFNRRE